MEPREYIKMSTKSQQVSFGDLLEKVKDSKNVKFKKIQIRNQMTNKDHGLQVTPMEPQTVVGQGMTWPNDFRGK